MNDPRQPIFGFAIVLGFLLGDVLPGSCQPAEPARWQRTAVLSASEATQAAAADDRFVYAIGNAQVAKYDRDTGRRVALSTGAARHLNSGFLWQGRLYCAHSNYPRTPELSEIKVLDRETMQLTTFKDFGNFGGSLTWAIRHEGHWWCNFARYGDTNSETFLVKFDDGWQERGRWTYPPEVVRGLGSYSLSGGIWRDGTLLVTGHDDPVLFRLRLPARGTVLDFVDKQQAPFTGQGIAHDPRTGGLVGIHRGKQQVVFAAPALLEGQGQGAGTRPNFVFILVDDLGWTDLGCYGSDFYQTPQIDQLARGGMKFTQAYSACTVCSPTRAAVMTGKYPARLHVTDWIPGLPPANPKLLVPDWTKHLPADEVTIARVLKDAGYATASIGKWHLGSEPYYPEKFGFDRNVAGTAAPAPARYLAPWKIATLSEGRAGDYLTDRLGDEAVQFIERHAATPFFLYLAHFAVHTPIQGRPDLVAKHRARLRPGLRHTNAVYAAMLESVDATVGRIRATLAERNLSERTILVFTSDNGGRVPTTSNHPLRVGKGSCYEGGVRVPLLIHWPGVTRPGSTCDVPAMSIDFYPTLLEMAGVRVPAGQRPDGESLGPLLRQSGGLKRDALFWHYPHYQHYQQGGTTPYGAIRLGNHRLVEFYDDMRVELYDLGTDLGECGRLVLW